MTVELKGLSEPFRLDLELATKEYKRRPVDPGKATDFFRTLWAEDGRGVDISVSVPECPFTQEKLREMRRERRGPIYLPEALSTQESRYLLGKMFPKMKSHSVEEGNTVTNEVVHSGWRQFDMSIDAPHLGTNESQLKAAMALGDEIPILNEFIFASQVSKLLTGKYLDEGTLSRILGSRRDGRVVRAHFDSAGSLDVHSFWNPGHRSSHLGGRFSRGVN